MASLDNNHDQWSAAYQSVRATSDFRANTGSVSLDRTVFPVPMAEPEPEPESAHFVSDESFGVDYSGTNIQVRGLMSLIMSRLMEICLHCIWPKTSNHRGISCRRCRDCVQGTV